MPKITDQEKQAVKAKYAGVDLELISFPDLDDDAIARAPDDAAWRMFRKKQDAKADGDDAIDFLIDACIVWPERDARAALLQRRPALREVWAGEISEIAGVRRNARRSKL